MNYKILKTACGKQIKVDIDDYYELSNFSWFILKAKNTNYARCNYKGKTKVITHIIAMMHKWSINGKVIDHINKNGKDNRKDNLNIITQRQNMVKDAGWKKSSSRFRGVSQHRNSWVARVFIKGKNYYLGSFKSELEAFAAVSKKRQEVGY